MKRLAGAFSLLAAVGGCVSTETGGGNGAPPINGPNAIMPGPANVPYAMGPGGVPVPMRAPQQMASAVPSGEDAAKAFIAKQMPPDIVQQVAFNKSDSTSGLMLAGGPGLPPEGGPGLPPPGAPGMMPGAPPGIIPAGYPPGVVAATGALTGNYASQFAASRTSVRFIEPRGMKISWMIPSPDGRRLWNDKPLEAPATYNFAQAAIYRLKLSDLPDYPGVDLYPTLEVVPANQRAMTFLAHSSVPVSFTADDFRMVNSGNYVVKVIYLPDPQFQDIAVGGGLGELISTQLDPGIDPIAEAAKRGSILLIVRLGNIDLELRHSPPMDAPPARPAAPQGQPAGMAPRGLGMAPPGMMPPGMMAGPGGGMMMPPPGAMMGPAGPGTPAFPSGTMPRPTPTSLPGTPVGMVTGEGGSLPPLPPQTNPLTPAQLAAGQPR
ncbi:MAG TPA: hypothetical protein VKA46_29825 [Gemmataceae bacterium]|nr:hypothetical protein [Gemmataceae bacterium]